VGLVELRATGAESGEKVQVAATISVVEDLVKQVGGDRVEVFSIVPVGGSPETFSAEST
jgi:iron/zinc/copper transport system substrate-binding protein